VVSSLFFSLSLLTLVFLIHDHGTRTREARANGKVRRRNTRRVLI
jgi:hypothetical protein